MSASAAVGSALNATVATGPALTPEQARAQRWADAGEASAAVARLQAKRDTYAADGDTARLDDFEGSLALARQEATRLRRIAEEGDR